MTDIIHDEVRDGRDGDSQQAFEQKLVVSNSQTRSPIARKNDTHDP